MTRRDEAVQIMTRIINGGLGNIIDDERLRDLSDSLNHTLHLWSGWSARSPKVR